MSLDHVKLHLVENMDDMRAFDAWLLSGPLQHGKMGVDTETTGLSPEKDRVRMVQLGDLNEGWAFATEGPIASVAIATEAVKRFQGTMLMHNAPFDYAMLTRLGVSLDRSRIEDTRIKAHIQEPHMSTALKPQTTRHVDRAAGAAQKELDAAIAKWGWDGVPITLEAYWIYAALDPVLTCHLDAHHSVDLPLHAFEVENAVQFVLESMMRRGAYVDLDYAREYQQKFLLYCDQARQWVQDQYGVAIGSNLKIIQILQEAGYEFSKLTESGALALDKEVLGGIDHPLAKTVLKHRQISKLTSTYLDHYITESINSVIHPSINSVGARTSRMSSSNPNLQNLPRTDDNNKSANVVRNCITSRPRHTLIMCDFDQIEMRGLAHLSQDPALIAAFHAPQDFFISLAQMVFQDTTITEKKDPRRQLVKSVGYGEIYGAGVEKLALTARVSQQQAATAKAAWNTAFPGVHGFKQSVYQEAAENKRLTGKAFVTCPLSGRRHYCDPGKEYALVNYLIQGWAAFLFKTKILELSNTAASDWMILPVHDEIILDAPEDREEEAVDILEHVMNDYTSFSVPITAGVSIGKRWAEKRDYERPLTPRG